MIFQILIACFGFFMMYVLRIHYRKGHLRPAEFGGWLAVWFGFIILAMFPEILSGVASTLHIGRVFDLLVIIAMGVLSLALVITRLSVLELRKKLEIIVREEALRSAKSSISRR